jgi:UDP-N-acetyl-D-galactosamine dehydrogenase
MISKCHTIKGANVLILGVTFKENCPDVRNTKVIDIYNELTQFELNVDVYDPWADPKEVKHEYDLDLLPKLNGKRYDAVIVAVAHDEFSKINFEELQANNTVIFDTKSFLDRSLVDARL